MTTAADHTFDVTAAAKSYLSAVRAARKADGGDQLVSRLQAYAALTAAEQVWHALTALDGQAALDAAEQYADTPTIAYAPPF